MSELSSPWVIQQKPLSEVRKQELKHICESMQAVSDAFYMSAIHTGNHAFIEFCGLMNEYIKACRDSINQDIDFTEANIHTGLALPLKPYQLDYITDKFSCIYGESFAARLKPTNENTAP